MSASAVAGLDLFLDEDIVVIEVRNQSRSEQSESLADDYIASTPSSC